jgi:hypothetical protein
MPSTGSELDAVRLVADCLRPRRLHLSASGKTRSSAISSYPRSLSAQSAAATSSQSAAGAVGWCSCFSPASEVSPNPSGAHQQCQVVRCAPTVLTSNFVAPEFPDNFSDRLSWFVVIWFGLVVRYPVCTASGPQLHGSLGSTGLRPMPPHYYRDLAHGPGVGSGLLPQLPPPTWAILAWPPHEAVAAFGTRLGRAGTVPDRSEGLDGAPFRSRGRALSRIQDRNNKHARGARVRGPGPAAYSQLGLCSTVSADILLVVIKRHQRARVPIVV